MAKRKRLTPARLDTSETSAPSPVPRKSLASGPRPPIADVAQDASASAALTEIAQTLSDARSEGRLIQRLPLDQIKHDYLVRDRMVVDADDMTTLIESLRARGQQTAIEVTDLGDGSYGLISGWRRVAALREIHAEHPETDTVLAIVRQPDDAADAYLAMVEENEIRVGLSYFERARIVARAVDAGVYNRDRVALAKLFHAASRPKRSKIGSFLRIVRALEDALSFPTAMNERNGLALAQALDADPKVADRVREILRLAAPTTAVEEAELITGAIRAPDAPREPLKSNAKSPPTPRLLRVGLHYKETSTGAVILSGAVLQDPAFKERLQVFLAQEDPK